MITHFPKKLNLKIKDFEIYISIYISYYLKHVF